MDFHSVLLQPLRVPSCRPLAGFIGIISDAHHPHFVGKQRSEQLIAKTFRAEYCRHVGKPVYVKRQRVKDRLTQYQIRARKRRFMVKDPAMRPRQIQVPHRLALGAKASPIKLRH